MKKKVIAVSLDPEILKAAKTQAEKEDRSLSNWVERAIKKALGA